MVSFSLQMLPSSSSVLREGAKTVMMKGSELIVEASSIMRFFQIDSSKFIRTRCPKQIYINNILHRDLLEQLLPKNMKKAKKLRLLISGRDKHVHVLFAMKCLHDTEAMDLSINELYYETGGTEEQMNFSHI